MHLQSLQWRLESSLKIYQNAKIARIDLDKNIEFEYKNISSTNGVYVMNINGEIIIDKLIAKTRDAIAVTDSRSFTLKANVDSQILFLEVPML